MTSPPLRPPEHASTPASGAPAPHPSPRSLRTLAVVRWLLLALVTLVAGYTVFTFWGPEHEATHRAQAADRYYCPMHPQIRSPDPGECPICHMHLEPIPEGRLSEDHTHTPARASEGGPAPSGVTALTVSEEAQRSIGLATQQVESASVGGRQRVPGVITAPETGLAQVRVRAPGFVEKVVVGQTGVRVSLGQPLAYVYSPDVYRAQEELIAATRWHAAGGASAAATDLTAAARRGLELLGMTSADIEQVVASGKPLRAVPVRAPSAGHVLRFNAVLGTRADPELVLYEIADLSKVWVVASVHERDLAALRVGTPARFTLSGSDRSTAAKVVLIEPLLDETTRSTRVRFVLPNPDGALRPGQYGEVDIELPAAQGLFVTRDAVIRTGENEYVYVATGPDAFEPRSVRIGLRRGDRVQVLEGLSAGERVVTRGSFMLDSESRLAASLAAAPAPAPDTSEMR